MKHVSIRTLVVLAGLAPASLAFAQAEVEPNDSRAQATQAFGASGTGMVAGDTITGQSTGASLTVAGPTSADFFRVKTAAAPLAIYRHRLVLATDGAAGHSMVIRGVTATGVDADLQFSSTGSVPPRMNQWYGFGRGEEFFYRVNGATATTGTYTSTYSVEPVTPVVVPASVPTGAITVSTVSTLTNTDSDFWVYDANFNPVPGFGNDDNTVAGGSTGIGLTSLATRDLAPGVYYVAVGRYNVANNQPSPSDERAADPYLDSENMALGTATTTTAGNTDLTISSSLGGSINVQVPVAAAYDIAWVQFTVAPNDQLAGSASLLPTAVSLTPSLPNAATSAVLAVRVNPGANPASTGITVRADLSAIGASANAALNDAGTNGDVTANDGIYSATVTPGSGAAVGVASLPVSISDAQGRTAVAQASLRITPAIVNLGQIDASNLPSSAGVNVTAGGITWAVFTIPCEAGAGVTPFFDITTLASGTIVDTEIGVYRGDGTLVASDDDDGIGAKSLLTFGAGSGEDIDGAESTAVANGRDGVMLAAGTYYLATGDYNVAFGATNFNVTTDDTTNAGTVQYRFITNLTCGASCDSIDFNNDGLFPADEDLVDFFVVSAGGVCSTGTCNDLDFNNDGLFPSDDDLVTFLRVLAGGPCVP